MSWAKKGKNITIITALTFVLTVGLFIFSRGFLLNRTIIKEKAGPCSPLNSNEGIKNPPGSIPKLHIASRRPPLSSYTDACSNSNLYSKFILLLVDALKFEFVQRMPHLAEVIRRGSAHNGSDFSCLFKFLADPPTTTMQRLKALTTGTMPTFIDASSNFNSYEVEEDSLIHQLYSAGKRIAFLGDDTWLSLFPVKYFTSPFVQGYPSFNAWDLDTVDAAVNESLHRILARPEQDNWDVLLAHVLGVDHCGHRYGPNHPEMTRKLVETDDLIKFLRSHMSQDTLLVIFGDHGMTSSGDHGGDSREESEAALIILSKEEKPTLTCPNPGFDENMEIAQVDLVPTLATLMSVPIPYSNIGQVILGLLPQALHSTSVAVNVAQIHRYVRHYSSGSAAEGPVIPNSLQHQLQSCYETLIRIFEESEPVINMGRTDAFLDAASEYLQRVRTLGRSTWTQFNVPLMYTGVLISFLSILSLVIYIYACPILEEASKDLTFAWLWPTLPYGIVISAALFHVTAPSLLCGLVSSSLAGLGLFITVLVHKSVRASCGRHRVSTDVCGKMGGGGGAALLNGHRKSGILRRGGWRNNERDFQMRIVEQSEILAIFLYGLTCLGVFSNSFVIREGDVLGFALLTVVSIHVLCSRSSLEALGVPFGTGGAEDHKFVKLPVVKKHFRCSWAAVILLAVIVRLSHVFFRCREELQDCTEEFLLHKQLASLPSDWVVHKFIRYGIELVSSAVFVVVFRHWLIYREISGSSKPAAFVARYVPTVLVVLNSAFRALQGLPFASNESTHFRPLIDHLPRLFQVVTAGALILLWVKPLCCIGRFRPSQSPPRVLLRRKTGENGADGVDFGGNCTEIESRVNANSHGSGLSKPSHQLRARRSSIVRLSGEENLCEDVFSSSILTGGVLLTLLLVQVTSEGISPAVTLVMYTVLALVGIYRNTPGRSFNSWSSAVAWSLACQYFFYATGHQPVFSAIPWDSAFIGTSNSSLGSSPESILTWIPPALSVMGNLHVSHIIFTFTLPLLVYWKGDPEKPETLMGGVERRSCYLLYGKFLALQGLKLLACMTCAAWQRRHLMVWKIFAPKLIFEGISIIVTSACATLSMLFVTRLDYTFQRAVQQERKWLHGISESI